MKFLWQQREPSETLAKFSVLTNESSAGSVLPSNLLENELLTCILENQANLMDHQTCSSCILLQYQFYLIALILEIDLIIHLGILSLLFKNCLFNLTLHYTGSNFTYFTWGGGFRPPSKMVLSGCFWLKSTSNPKSR